MINRNGKWWLAVVALCCVSPAAFASFNQQNHRGCEPRSRERCQQVQVPEGGSTALYLLGAGLTCVGAMFLRSRTAKPSQS